MVRLQSQQRSSVAPRIEVTAFKSAFPANHSDLPSKSVGRIVVVAAIWLTVQMFDQAFVIYNSPELTLLACTTWILVPLILCRIPLVRPFVRLLFSGESISSALIPVFICTSLISVLVSTDPGRSLAYWGITVTMLMICYALHNALRSHVPRLLRVYSLIGALALLPIYLRGATPALFGGRLTINEIDHPNHLGRMCYTVLAASLAWENTPLRLGIVLLMTAMLVATGSRASLLAALITIAVFGAFTRVKQRRHVLIAMASVAGAAACAVLWGDRIAQYTELAFQLQDLQRGMGSGFTGRMELWSVMLDAFLSHPVTGVGLRVSSDYLPASLMKSAGSAHNGFVSVLVEVGLIGAVPFFLWLTAAAMRIVKDAVAGDKVARLAASLVVGFLVTAMFESVLLNLANPTAVLFWMFVLGSSARRSRRGWPTASYRRFHLVSAHQQRI